MADTMQLDFLRSQLADRRDRLEAARTALAPVDSGKVSRLLQEVAAALARIEEGSYGLCQVCHEPVEAERLLADPLVTACLDHLDTAGKRALEADLELALRIQKAMLPDPSLRSAHWETAWAYAPAGHVSGDYFDLVPATPGDGLFFATGDVAGKGVAAALLMSNLQAIFRSLLPLGLPLPEILRRANRVFCENTIATHYATMVCGRLDQAGGLEIVNAGHCPALVVTDAGVQQVRATGLPLGLFSETEYSVNEIRLTPGATLALYTDGITEARAASGEEYGVARLGRAVKQACQVSLEQLPQRIFSDLRGFTGGARQLDDQTLLLIRPRQAAR
jgi:sigma-B regulation protein RsbU (phosphoserine phosphatase)